MTEGNSGNNGRNGNNGLGTPWPPGEEVTPVEPPPIRENEPSYRALIKVVNRLDTLHDDIKDIARQYRLARTPFGQEMSDHFLTCLRNGFDDLKEAVVSAIASGK